MVEAYRQTDPFGELLCDLPFPESTGAAATVTLTVTGRQPETGTVNVYGTYPRAGSGDQRRSTSRRLPAVSKMPINAVPAPPLYGFIFGTAWSHLTARHKGFGGMKFVVAPQLLPALVGRRCQRAYT